MMMMIIILLLIIIITILRKTGDTNERLMLNILSSTVPVKWYIIKFNG